MEKGICQICGKTVETEIPATGHIPGDSITIADGKFKSTCTVCSQNVTLNAQTPALSLDFDDVAAEFGLPVRARLPINPDVAFAYDSGLMETVNTDALAGAIEAVEKAE